MTVYGCTRRCSSSATSDLLVSPDGSTICLLPQHNTSYCQDDLSPLSLQTKMSDVVRCMSKTDSGLDVKDRIWLKLKIPDAFTGTNLVNWLYRNVHGFSERREARKYAAGLLKGGFVVSAVNNQTFSEQRYYHISPNIGHVHAERLEPPSTLYSNPCFEQQKPSSRTPGAVSSSSTSKSRKTWQTVRNKLTRRGSFILDSFHGNAV